MNVALEGGLISCWEDKGQAKEEVALEPGRISNTYHWLGCSMCGAFHIATVLGGKDC
jgi:hypothetical protein